MTGTITKRHFFLVAREFGFAAALRLLLSGRRVALPELIRLWGGK